MDESLFESCLDQLPFSNSSTAWSYSVKHGGSAGLLQLKELVDLLHQMNASATAPDMGDAPDFNLMLIMGTGVHLPICVSRSVFIEIIDSLRIPRALVQTMTANNGHFAAFTTYPRGRESSGPDALYIMCSTPVAPKPGFSCCLRVHPTNYAASGIVFDDDDDRIRQLTATLDLRKRDLTTLPISLLTYLLEVYGQGNEKWRQKLDEDVQQAEQSTGLTRWRSNKVSAAQYEELNKEMHICKTNITILLMMTAFEEQFGRFVRDMVDRVDELRAECALPPTARWQKAAVWQNLDYHLTTCHLRRLQTETLRDRIQTQIDVMHGFIVQRDAQATMSMAAVAQQDSGAMRTIAVLTLFFLPATLVSAIFSSGVIIHVPDLWWAFLLAVTLSTVTVFVLWICYMRYRSRQPIAGIAVREKY